MNLSKILITGVIVASLGTGSVAFAAANQSSTSNLSNSNTTQSQTQNHGQKFQKFGRHHGDKFGDFGKRGGHDFGMFKDAAAALNIDQKTLISDLKLGKSLADIAASKNISKATLISKLEASAKTHLDQAVKSGKLTAAKETQILAKMKTQINKMVDQKGLPKMDFKRGGHDFGMFKDAAAALNIDQKTLISDLKSGKSLADIAASKNISKATLISKLEASAKTHLDQAVKSGKLTAAKETQILTKMKTQITKMVDQKGLPKMGFKRGDHEGQRGHHGDQPNKSTNAPANSSSSAKGL